MVKKHLANVFTFLNACFGLLQLLFLVEGRLTLAFLSFLFAIVCDGLDGYVARLFNQCSLFGKQLDSLADMTTFGVGSVFWIYIFATNLVMPLRIFLSFFHLYHSLKRLAQFNSTNQKAHYVGLPITFSAFIIVSTLYLSHVFSIRSFILILIIGSCSVLMNVPVKTFKCHHVDHIVTLLANTTRAEEQHD